MVLKGVLSKVLVMLMALWAGFHEPTREVTRVAPNPHHAFTMADPELAHRTIGGKLHRSLFSKGFIFGASSSAYQYEGAASEGGRGPSIWDTASRIPGTIDDNSTGDVAVDQYHRYKEDIELMKGMGLDSYRFSISWSRIFPDGLGPQVNQEGVAYYNNLIDTLLSKGIQPFVTLYHWDMPQALEDSIGGWMGPAIVPAYAAYAEACFQIFGDRVKHWITFNEPHTFSLTYADEGCINAAGICGSGIAADRPYTQGHHVILAHAKAVEIYRTKFQAMQGGSIGLTLDSHWYEPLTNSSADKDAAVRIQLFSTGWFLDPIFFGNYPEVMRTWLGTRLPFFTEEESRLVKGSVDFVGINHYTSYYVVNHQGEPLTDAFYIDAKVTILDERDGVRIGPKGACTWLNIVPWGMERILSWVRHRYGNPPVYVTENGLDENTDPSLPLETILKDNTRIKYFNDYMSYMLIAMRDGADVRGYFVWSLLDNFEWLYGYTVRFGLHYIDYNNNLTRYPKASVQWFKNFLQRPSDNYEGHDFKLRKRRAELHLDV